METEEERGKRRKGRREMRRGKENKKREMGSKGGAKWRVEKRGKG